MKIGIIVHSKTGNTFSVAKRLEESLAAAGHAVGIEKVIAVNDDQMEVDKIQLSNIPNISEYDLVLIGAPVRGFSLSAVMSAYLLQNSVLAGKDVFCYVTQFFPHPMLGGNRAIGQMKKICETQGAKVSETGVINWSSMRKEKMIKDMIEKVSRLV